MIIGDDMTANELESIYRINREIEMWEQELSEIRAQVAAQTKKITGMPFHNTNDISDPTAEMAMKMADIEMIILGRKKELVIEKGKIIRFIFSIEDSFVRQLVKYRCVDCLRWEQIGELVGYERTTCSKRYREFLQTLEEKENEGKGTEMASGGV